jgi:hypothetical protein
LLAGYTRLDKTRNTEKLEVDNAAEEITCKPDRWRHCADPLSDDRRLIYTLTQDTQRYARNLRLITQLKRLLANRTDGDTVQIQGVKTGDR